MTSREEPRIMEILGILFENYHLIRTSFMNDPNKFEKAYKTFLRMGLKFFF